MHEDGSHFTVNVPLTQSFEGGGTFFPTKPSPGGRCCPPGGGGLIVRPPRGVALLHEGRCKHAGKAVSEGSRIILVAFFRKSPARFTSSTQKHMREAWLHRLAAKSKISVSDLLPIRFPEDVYGDVDLGV